MAQDSKPGGLAAVKVIEADTSGIRLALEYLKTGKSVVYPTDTAYGLGVDATNAGAVRRMYKIKERPLNQPVHVAVSSLAMAKKYAKLGAAEEKIFKRFMPGALTIILDLSPNLSLASLAWRSGPRQGRGVRLLSGGTGTLGIRVPDNEVALALVKRLKKPITTSSANPKGSGAPYSAEDSLEQFKNKKYQPDLFLDAGKLKKKKPSTLIRVEDDIIKILRKGPISKKQIEKCLDSKTITFPSGLVQK